MKYYKNIKRKIIPIGGGLLRLGETISIDKFIVKESDKKNPNILFIPTASKDLSAYCSVFQREYEKLGCQIKILRLYKRKRSPVVIEKLITNADIIYVGGGDYNILFSIWKKHKIVSHIRAAYQRGTILTGLSAGCAIWFEYLIDVDRSGKDQIKKGLGILNGIVVPHFKAINEFLTEVMSTNKIITAIEDKCAVVYVNEQLKGSVSVSDENAFTINPPYDKKKKVASYFKRTK